MRINTPGPLITVRAAMVVSVGTARELKPVPVIFLASDFDNLATSGRSDRSSSGDRARLDQHRHILLAEIEVRTHDSGRMPVQGINQTDLLFWHGLIRQQCNQYSRAYACRSEKWRKLGDDLTGKGATAQMNVVVGCQYAPWFENLIAESPNSRHVGSLRPDRARKTMQCVDRFR